MKKTLSQQDILKKPELFASELTDAEFTVLDIALSSVALHGNGILFNQTYLAEQEGFTIRTVNRAVSKFKKLGLFLIKQRRKGCAYLSITSYFSFPRVRAAFSRLFSRYPVFKISLPLLLTGYVSTYMNKDFRNNPESGRLFRIGLNRSSGNVRPQKRGDKVNEVTVRKILEIERALLARGETLDSMDANKLAAFPEECLDAVSVKMRGSHPKKPFAFFMHLCMAWCKENNLEPVFEKADALRQLGILSKMRISRPAGIKQEIKEQKPYSEQVKQDMQREKKAHEARSRSFSSVQLLDEVAGMKRHVEELTARVEKGERSMEAALMIAKGVLARREHELSISTETKEAMQSHTNTAPTTPIVRHKANLFSYEEGEESAEDILD